MNYRASLSAFLVSAVGIFAACQITVTDSGSSDGGTGADSSVASDAAVATDSSTVTEGDGGTCSITDPVYEAPACDTCAKDKCCDKMEACFGSADCVEVYNAAVDCQNVDGGAAEIESCVNAAKATYANGAAAFDAFTACVATGCQAACQ